MRRAILTMVALSVSCAAAFAATHTQVIQFAPGDRLEFRLRGGDVHISRGTDPHHVVVRYTPDPEKPDADRKVQLRTRTAGSLVQIEIKAPASLSVDTEIDVPSPVSLRVQVTEGDVTIEGVQGDKTIRLLAGDLKIGVGSRSDLRQAVASVRIGDMDAPVWGQTHGWLGRTWKYEGNGPYTLDAHVSFGDVELNSQ